MNFRGPLLVTAFLALPCISTFARADLPADAKAMLKTFPGERITLDLVVGRAMQASDSFQKVKALLPNIEVPALQGQAPLDTVLVANATRNLNRNEPQNPFGTTKQYSTLFSIGAQSYFSTGTLASAEIGTNDTDQIIPFAIPPSQQFREVRGTFTLTQNLLNDAFGYGARRAKEAGALSTQAARFGFEDAVESWALQIIQVYYDAWLAQAQAKVADTSIQYRNRLVEITSIKARRGTAEQPDLLQTKSALMNARVQKSQAEQALNDKWRNLVTSLKLPATWIGIDPKELPIELDAPVESALELCKDGAQAPTETPRSKQYQLRAEAAKLTAERARNAVTPDIELFGRLITNGVDRERMQTAFSEARKVDHPAWIFGLNFSFPLGQNAERAAAHQAVADQDRTEAEASEEAANLKLSWINSCANLKQLNRSHAFLQEAYEDQTRRARLEEERFRIGRTTTLAVIQAADDANIAQGNLNLNEANRRLVAWQVKYFQRGIKAYLERLRSAGGPK